MGRIECITVNNFKSYRGKQVIGPFKTFTAIIGPNGSGKSNIMDAISFVLGVKTQQLRGAQLRDLVYQSPDLKEPPNDVFVELKYVDDADVPTIFRRAISSSSADYKVNKKKVTWKEYVQELEKINVLVKVRNFLVFQGDVESIAQKSPQQLTELFEEISGAAELKTEYQKLDEQAKEKETEYLRAFERKKNLAKERKQIKEQKEEAERFQILIEKKNQTIKEYYLWQLFHSQKNLIQAIETLGEKRTALDKEKSNSSKKHEDFSEASKSLGKLRLSKNKLSKSLNVLRSDLDKNQSAIVSTEEQIRHLKNSLDKSEKLSQTLKEDLENQGKKKKLLQSQVTDAEHSLQAFEENLEEQENNSLKLSAEQIKIYEKLKIEAGQKTGPLRTEHDRAMHVLKSKQSIYNDLNATANSLIEQISSLNEPISKLSQRKEHLEKQITDSSSQLDQLRENHSTTTRLRQETEKTRSDLLQKIDQVSQELSNARSDRQESERELKINDCLDYLKRVYPSVRGRVSDLCKPSNRKYNTAVSIALGKNFDAVIVDDEATAIDCIQYFKDQRAGVITIIPLDTIQVSPIKESYRRIPGSFKLLIDVIQYDDSLYRAFQYVCGNTLVCDSMDEARKLCYGKRSGPEDRNEDADEEGFGYKVVTLQGSMIHKNGNMTGGTVGGGMDKSSRWDEQEMKKLKKQKESLMAQLQELNGRMMTHQDEIREQYKITELSEHVKMLQKDLQATEQELYRWNHNVSESTLELNRKLKERASAEIAFKNASSDAERLEKEISNAEQDVFANFNATVGVDNIQEYEESRVRLAKESSRRRVELTVLLSKLKNELESENKKDLKKPIKALNEKIQITNKKLKELESQLSASLKEKTKLEHDIQAGETDQNELSVYIQELQEKIKVVEVELSEFNSQRRKLESEIGKIEAEIEGLKSQRHDLLNQSRLEQVSLPLLEEDEDNGLGLDADSEDSQYRVDSQLIGSIDFEQLKKDRRNVSNLEEFNTIKTNFQEQIDHLVTQVQSLTPNLKAIEQYDEICARFDECVEAFEKAKQDSKLASQAFHECQEQRRKLFMDAFNFIAGEIDEIYKNLTKSERFPLGGTAYLNVESIERPYEQGVKFHAMPPMKRFRDMEQLSGGEKTVAALALLFAIHSFKPSPFFVLDEIDAALDSANVNKVSNYIRSRSQQDHLQCVVISLKDSFYQKADALVGVYKDQSRNSSSTLTLDLSVYLEDD